MDVVRQAYIVPFDICDKRTFNEVCIEHTYSVTPFPPIFQCEDIIVRIKRNFREFHIPPIVYLVANKIGFSLPICNSLHSFPSDVADRREVTDEEAKELAKAQGIFYAETSARLNRGIKEVSLLFIFHSLIPLLSSLMMLFFISVRHSLLIH